MPIGNTRNDVKSGTGVSLAERMARKLDALLLRTIGDEASGFVKNTHDKKFEEQTRGRAIISAVSH